MSEIARRAFALISFQGVDITNDIKPYLLSMVYTDNEADETDDLQIVLQDREGVWLQKWLQDAIDASASNSAGDIVSEAKSFSIPATCQYGMKNSTVKYMQQCLLDLGYDLPKYGADGSFGAETLKAVKAFQSDHPPLVVDGSCGPKTWTVILTLMAERSAATAGTNSFAITANIVAQSWKGSGDSVLSCGAFELDDVQASGPPAQVSLKATSLPFSAAIRQTKKSQPWEAYYLSGILSEMAKRNGMSVMYLPDNDPYYERVEQYEQSDIAFLSKLCQDAGYSLKCTNNSLVVFDQVEYEDKAAVRTFTFNDGSYTKWTIRSSTAEAQYSSCRVSYVDPSTGKSCEAVVKVSDYNEKNKNNQQLEITAKVASKGEALALAEKMLRLHNKFEKTVRLTLPGDTAMVAGVTVELKSFGSWSGKYIVRQSVHRISNSGYTTDITLRKVLGGY